MHVLVMLDADVTVGMISIVFISYEQCVYLSK